MTPEMQASEMVHGMINMQTYNFKSPATAINCARYAVNQIIQSCPCAPTISVTYADGTEEIRPTLDYWLRVQEILNEM